MATLFSPATLRTRDLGNPIDEAHDRLHRNGSSTGDIGMVTEHGPCWLVTCTRGEHFWQTMAPTQTAARQETCRQAPP
jgi:hypothetical protein